MDDQQEFQRRRRAIRLRVQGVSHKVILEKVQRSRAWLSKWQKRFEQQGTLGLRTHSRRPHHTPGVYSAPIVQLIVRTRRRFVKQKVGLRGARAIRRELRKVLGKQTPSLSTINRVLQKRHLIFKVSEAALAYFPRPVTVIDGILHALDWTCRYLEDGPKVYAFHTLNLRTRACTQTIAADKSYETVQGHCLHTWKTLGIPQFLQLDNDAAFCGGYKTPRILRAIRSAVFVSGHRTDLFAYRRTQMQWRGRRVERLVGARLLGTTAVCFVRACVSRQSDLRPLVYDRLCTAGFRQNDAPTGTTLRTALSPERHSTETLARSVANHGRTYSLPSQGHTGWHNYGAQRNLEGEQTFGRQIRLDHPRHPLPTIGNLVSAFCST